MTRSFFARASYVSHGIFVIAIFTLISGVIFRSQFSFEAQAQQLVKVAAVEASIGTPSDTFLKLAASVGQIAPAQRLVDYKLKFDPSSQPRYWAVVDFNQPSTNKRLYVFDTVGKKVNTYYVAHGRGSEGAKDD